MGKTVRRQPKHHDPRKYQPTKRARKIEKRSRRQADRVNLREYVR